MRVSRNTVRTVLLGVLLIGPSNPFAAEIDRNKAAGVMAAYLRHIAALTTWPSMDAAGPNQPIRIGVVGSDPNGVMAPMREAAGV